ncbi:hypothetical protein GCM10009858_11600 [Terrabacter carboxydivorans]|uniref:Ig-like domain-containing protein n=2 Tax=Terrabacter carboxydivorans TaxID=619730 RepID=A0ABN3L124_9MICO
MQKNSRLRTVKAVVASLGVAAAMVVAGNVPAAFAVHDETFQLDGDVSASTTTNVGGTTQAIDWSTLFGSTGNELALPSGYTASVFSKDFNTNANGSFNTSDATTYTTGSKDTLPISGWQCTASNNVNSKIDVMNSYATAYTAPNGHQLLYFALERNTNSGDANVAFWFLQDQVACNDNGSTATFSGQHRDGDLLIVSAFTNGGAVSTVDVYRWNGGANGTLGTTPVAHGVDCKTTAAGDTGCATVNTGTITTPWPTANFKDGVGHSLRIAEFYEGGLDLTANNLGGKCFNTFTGDTRSSQSLTATLFDYSLGNLGECTSTTVTTPNVTTQEIPASGTLSVTDSALITVTGIQTFSATLKFFICGPTALDATGSCTTGGDQIGTTQAITTGGTYPSTAASITEVGRYCWRAEFSGDSTAGVPASKDDSTGECFTVTPRQSGLDTQAGASPVDFGNAVTDTATLSNTANHQGSGGVGTDGSINPATAGGKAGGTITFTLYKDDCTTVATGTGSNPQTVNVSGDSVYGPVSFTPDAPGTYHWKATYTGDAPNTLGSSHNGSCTDTKEDVVVRQIPTEISTAQKAFPNDSATITSSVAGNNLPSNGTVIFRLYDTLANCQAGGDTVNSGGLLYKETKTGVGGTHTTTVGTANTSVAVDSNTTVYWTATYATGDTAHTGRASVCTENTQFTFTNDSGPGTLFP